MHTDLLNQHLIDAIYDAAIDEDRWQNVVDMMSEKVPGTATTITRHVLADDVRVKQFTSGIPSEFVAKYDTYYKTRNPVPRRMLTVTEQSPVYVDDIFERKEYYDTEYFREYLKPQKFATGVYSRLLAEGNQICMLGALVHEDGGPSVAGKAYNCLEKYAPHVSRSARISRHLSSAGLIEQSLEDTLAHVSASIFVLTKTLAIEYANNAARDLLASGAGLHLDANGWLHADDTESDQLLYANVAHALKWSQPSPPFTLRHYGGRRPLTAIALKFSGDLARQTQFDRLFSDGREFVSLFIFNTNARVCPASELVSSTFDLTPCQTQLALALFQGKTLQTYSDGAGLSRNTARNHLAAIMHKMGTKRQSDVVTIIAQLATLSSDGVSWSDAHLRQSSFG